MIAADPEQELILGESLRGGLPGFGMPVLVVVERFEGEFLEPDFAAVSAGTGRLAFAAIVGEHFEQGIGQQLRPSAGPGTAEQIERNKDHQR